MVNMPDYIPGKPEVKEAEKPLDPQKKVTTKKAKDGSKKRNIKQLKNGGKRRA